jgi:dienelactone hydrolase
MFIASLLQRLLKYILYFISGAAILTAGLVAYLIWFQQPFYFPKPTGQYAVGKTTYHWIDAKRRETLNNAPEYPNRELMVNIWYPAEGTLGDKPATPYAPYLVEYMKKHNKMLWLLALSRPTYSYANFEATILQNKLPFPVIIFSHGAEGGTRDSNTAHCEELASHGYVVIGISHTYQGGVVKFPDGRIADSTKFFLGKEKMNFIERRKSTDKEETNIWVSDVQFVLDQLEKINHNKTSMFFERLDQNNIGIFGQSMGGSTAIQACRRDTRIKACVDLDGSLFGSDVTKSFDKPFMGVFAGDSVNIVNQLLSTQKDWKSFRITTKEEAKMVIARYISGAEQLANAIGHDAYVFVVNNAGHIDFTDTTFLKSASLISRLVAKFRLGLNSDFGVGSINSFRVTKIATAYLVNFFDKYLKDQPSELLDGREHVYPEVEVKQWEKK